MQEARSDLCADTRESQDDHDTYDADDDREDIAEALGLTIPQSVLQQATGITR